MSRSAFPLVIADISAFSRALRDELAKRDALPGHVETLNLVCRAAGYRNYQSFRAATPETPLPAPVDRELVARVARHFDAEGRMLRWPARLGQANLCLWVLWSRIPADTSFTEREISDLLKRWHTFGDHALLRRALYDGKHLSRTVDGRDYRRIEQKPPAELRPLLALISRAPAPAA